MTTTSNSYHKDGHVLTLCLTSTPPIPQQPITVAHYHTKTPLDRVIYFPLLSPIIRTQKQPSVYTRSDLTAAPTPSSCDITSSSSVLDCKVLQASHLRGSWVIESGLLEECPLQSQSFIGIEGTERKRTRKRVGHGDDIYLRAWTSSMIDHKMTHEDSGIMTRYIP